MAQTKDTRQQILDSAAMLFHTQSYSDVGIASICEKAGVSKGSFFHFFPSKRDLAVAVLEQFSEQINTKLIAISDNYPPMERFKRFVEEIYNTQKKQAVEFGHMPGCPFGNMVMEQATQDEILRQKANSCLQSLSRHIRTAVSDAVKEGDFPALDEKATADAMLAYLEGIQMLAKAQNNPKLIRQLGPAVTGIRIAKKN